MVILTGLYFKLMQTPIAIDGKKSECQNASILAKIRV